MNYFRLLGQVRCLPILAVLLCIAPEAPAADAAPEAKYYRPPRSLRSDNGLSEFGLIDPFRRGDDRAPAEPTTTTDSSLQRTSMGELSDGFRILTIIVPKRTDQRKPTALIQLEKNADPILVQEGDLVRIERRKSDKKNKTAVELALERYTFYIHIKKITATGLEIFYNKQRPDDTLILRW